MSTLFAPTAVVPQLYPAILLEELHVVSFVEYRFQRRVMYKNYSRWNDDNRKETLRQQRIRMEQFIIDKDTWTAAEAQQYAFLHEIHRGRWKPLLFTAPDNGETYEVYFAEDTFEIKVGVHEYRECRIILETAGDLDNTVDNGTVYENYPLVESTAVPPTLTLPPEGTE